MREYFAHKLVSSLAPWKGIAITGADKIQMRYGLFFIGIDFLITYENKAVIIVIIDGIYKAPDLDVTYGQDTAFDLRKKMMQVEKMDACEVIIAGRHVLNLKNGVVNMTGIYNHEKCFDKVFIHMKQFLQLPPLPVEEASVGCGWCLRRKSSQNRIVPIPVEPFAVTHAQILALLNGGRKKKVFASDQLGVTDRSAPYGTIER